MAGRNKIGQDYKFTLQSAQAESLDGLSGRVVLSHAKDQVVESRRSATFGQYLKALAFGVPDEVQYAIFTDLDEQKVDDGAVYSPRSKPQIRQVTYSAIAWKRLFRSQ